MPTIDLSLNDILSMNFDHNTYHNCDWQHGKKGSLKYSQMIRQGLFNCCFLEGFMLSSVTSCLNSETETAEVESSCQRRNSEHKMSISSEKLNKMSKGHL